MKKITDPEVLEIARWLDANPEWRAVCQELLAMPEEQRHQIITTFMEQRKNP